jgi:hypothetical protein
MSAAKPVLDEFARWVDEQESIARQNYSSAALCNDRARADMFANRARCLDIARDAVQEFLLEAKL